MTQACRPARSVLRVRKSPPLGSLEEIVIAGREPLPESTVESDQEATPRLCHAASLVPSDGLLARLDTCQEPALHLPSHACQAVVRKGSSRQHTSAKSQRSRSTNSNGPAPNTGETRAAQSARTAALRRDSCSVEYRPT